MSFDTQSIEIILKKQNNEGAIDFEMLLKAVVTVFLISSYDTGNKNKKTACEMRNVHKIWMKKEKKEYEGR